MTTPTLTLTMRSPSEGRVFTPLSPEERRRNDEIASALTPEDRRAEMRRLDRALAESLRQLVTAAPAPTRQSSTS